MLRVKAVKPLEDHWLRLTLSDGRSVDRDVEDVLVGPVFGDIKRDASVFRRVRVSHGTLSWPGGVDIDPDVLIWDGPPPLRSDATPVDRLRVTRPNVGNARAAIHSEA